jgi:predicted NBD/HSP70 family sugar kinase
VPLVLALERNDGYVTRYEAEVFGPGSARAAENYDYAGRLVKTLLWARGGWRLVVGGPTELGAQLTAALAPGGEYAFDAQFMSGIYEQPFAVEAVAAEAAPAARESSIAVGRHLEGCRLGFDAGASDYKAAAVLEGEVVWSEEFPWDPRPQADPEYHYGHIQHALRAAAEHLPRVDAIGISTAGVVVSNRLAVASLFRGVSPDLFDAKVRDLFLRIQADWGGIPLEVANDGDVAALAGAMSLETTRLLGVALGSSEAAGYVDSAGNLTGWLNELAFVPVDYAPEAPVDDWSGFAGVGSQFFCQVGAVRLAGKAGIEMDPSLPLPEKLKVLQAAMDAGDERARQAYVSTGRQLGYAVAQYADLYDLNYVLLMGRVTSGEGGPIIVEEAHRVLATEFPELTGLVVDLPDEKARRVGQAIAAASLPALPPS